MCLICTFNAICTTKVYLNQQSYRREKDWWNLTLVISVKDPADKKFIVLLQFSIHNIFPWLINTMSIGKIYWNVTTQVATNKNRLLASSNIAYSDWFINICSTFMHFAHSYTATIFELIKIHYLKYNYS